MKKSVSFTTALLLLLVSLLMTDAQVSPTTSSHTTSLCQDVLLQFPQSDSCTPWANCTGLNCMDTTAAKNVSFVIDRCTDPLQYHITELNSESGDVSSHVMVNTSEHHTTFNTSSGLHLFFGRNASHAHISVHSRSGGDMMSVSVPNTTLYLNASDCMCQSLAHIKDGVQSPIETNCTTDIECVGLECYLSLSEKNDVFVDTEIFPCAYPPGMLFVAESQTTPRQVLFTEFFDRSKNTTFLDNPFIVEVTHRPYSMIIHGVLMVDDTPYNVIPETQVILDKENCPPAPTPQPTDSGHTPSRTSHGPLPTNAPSGISPETCTTLQQLSSRPPSSLGKCSTNKACNTINCTTLNGYHTKFVFLPCNDPPAVHTIVTDNYGDVVYDRLVTNRTEIPLGSFGVSLVMIVHDEPGNMAVEVRLYTPITGDVPFLPKTSIPVDSCQCIAKGQSLPSNCLPGPTTTSSAQSSTMPHTHIGRSFVHSTTGIAVMSTVAFVILLLVVVAIAVFLVVCLLRVKKRSSGFQRLRLGVQDMDDDDKSADL